MNTLIAKNTAIYSLIIGAVLAVIGSFNFMIGLVTFALGLLCAPAVIIYMKKRAQIGFLDNQQAAALGAISGFCATVSFFIVFTPMTLIFLKLAPLINKLIPFINPYHYSYGIQYIIRFDALWLFFVIIIMIGIVAALTNSATAMSTIFLISQFEKRPDDIEEIDIHIE